MPETATPANGSESVQHPVSFFGDALFGSLTEWLMVLVLKTSNGASHSKVRTLHDPLAVSLALRFKFLFLIYPFLS